MSYRDFCDRVKSLATRVGGISVRFYHDKENGRYFAYCSEGVTIVGHSESTRVLVKWGMNQHRAMAALG